MIAFRGADEWSAASQASECEPIGERERAEHWPRNGMPRIIDNAIGRSPLFAVTYLSKLAVPPLGAAGFGISLPLIGLTSMAGLFTGRLVFNAGRLAAFTAMISLLWMVQITREAPFSPLSILLLTVLHLPYVLELRKASQSSELLDAFHTLAGIIAVCGVFQYALQFLIGPQLAFPIENYVPPQFLIAKFNTQGYLEYGSDLYRTNGIFMLEPSFYSQLVAIAIVSELVERNRLRRVALYAVAMVLSYSGTGMILLGVCLPCLAIARRRWDLIGVMALLVVAALALAAFGSDLPYVSVFVKRASEFSSTGSSGFARFVSGFYLFDQYLWLDPARALFGVGAGTFQAYADKATYAVAGMALFKIVFEFGLIGGVAYFSFLYFCVWQSSAPGMLRLAVGVSFMLSGIYIPFAHGLALSLLIWNTAPGQARQD